MSDFDAVSDSVYGALREVMLPYVSELDVKRDGVGDFYVDTFHVMANSGSNSRPLWFGGVKVNKRYVSFHLMPVYMNPGLLDDISGELRKRMQGKSCFNFVAVDLALFAELSALTGAGLEDYRGRGFIG